MTRPKETFAELCYLDAVDTVPANDPDWCVFVNTPRRIDWSRNENSTCEPDSDEFDFLVRFPHSFSFLFVSTDKAVAPSAEHRPYAKPDSPAIDSFVSSSSVSNGFGYAFPFPFSDSPSAMTIPDPHDIIHYSPTPIKRAKRPTRWDRIITRFASFAHRRFQSLSFIILFSLRSYIW